MNFLIHIQPIALYFPMCDPLLKYSYFLPVTQCQGTIQVLRHHVFDFLGPPTQHFDDLQYCKSSKIAIF